MWRKRLLREQEPEGWTLLLSFLLLDIKLYLSLVDCSIHFCPPLCEDLLIKHLLSLKTLWTFFTRWSLRASQARCSVRPPWTSRARYSRWPLHEEQCKYQTIAIKNIYFGEDGVTVSPFHLSLLDSLWVLRVHQNRGLPAKQEQWFFRTVPLQHKLSYLWARTFGPTSPSFPGVPGAPAAPMSPYKTQRNKTDEAHPHTRAWDNMKILLVEDISHTCSPFLPGRPGRPLIPASPWTKVPKISWWTTKDWSSGAEQPLV